MIDLTHPHLVTLRDRYGAVWTVAWIDVSGIVLEGRPDLETPLLFVRPATMLRLAMPTVEPLRVAWNAYLAREAAGAAPPGDAEW